MAGRLNFGLRFDRRLDSLSLDDWDFIWSAVEAGWTTPRILREVEANPSATFAAARYARLEMRARHKVCEHCRRDIATGKISANKEAV